MSLYCLLDAELADDRRPGSYLANSGRVQFRLADFTRYPITCASMPFCGYSRRCDWISTSSGKVQGSRCDSTNASRPGVSSSLMMMGTYLGCVANAAHAREQVVVVQVQPVGDRPQVLVLELLARRIRLNEEWLSTITRPSRSRILPRGARIGTDLMLFRAPARCKTPGLRTWSSQKPAIRKTKMATVRY